MQRFLNKIIPNFNEYISIFDVIEDFIFLMRVDGDSFCYEYINKAGLKKLNLDNQAVGKRMEEVVPPDMLDDLLGKYKQAVKTKEALQFEESIAVSGRMATVKIALNPIITKEGNCEYVIGVFSNMTDEKDNLKKSVHNVIHTAPKLEQLYLNGTGDTADRSKPQKNYQQSENETCYRKMVEMSPDPVVMFKNRKVLYINKAGKDLAGISHVSEIIGKSILDYSHPEERDNVERIICGIENGILTGNEQEPIRMRFVQQNGNIVYTDVNYVVFEENGEKIIQVAHRNVSKWVENEKQLAYMAYHDPLTGLNNRRSFLDKLEKRINQAAYERDKKFAVMYLDMDIFKEVNDKWGHDTGDKLLVQFAKRLTENVRENDILCRIGGDEFIILLENVTDRQYVTEIVDRLHKIIQEPYSINGNVINVTISAGISIYPHDGETSNKLINNADKALYFSKGERNRFHFFSQCL